jgi:hypothetical protein
VFCGHIGADARLSNHSGDRRVIDDGTAAVLQHVLDFVFHTKKYAFQIDSNDLLEN